MFTPYENPDNNMIAECLCTKFPCGGGQLIYHFIERVRSLSFWRRTCCWSSYFLAVWIFFMYLFLILIIQCRNAFCIWNWGTVNPSSSFVWYVLKYILECGMYPRLFDGKDQRWGRCLFTALSHVSVRQPRLNTAAKLKSCPVWLVLLPSDLAVTWQCRAFPLSVLFNGVAEWATVFRTDSTNGEVE